LIVARYAFGNTLASFKRSHADILEVTTASRFDSAFVPNAISLPASDRFIETMPFIDAASATTIWLQFEHYGNWSTSPGGGKVVEGINSSGVPVFRLWGRGTANTVYVSYWNGSAWVDDSTINNASFTSTALKRITVKIICGASGSVALYVGGTLIGTTTIASASMNNIAAFRLSSPDASQGFFSQILCADYDLRDCRYMSSLANANATYTAGTGTYTDINDAVLDEGTAIVLPASGNKKTFTKPAITVPGGYQIAALCLGARARVSGGVVTDGKLTVRSSTTDSSSAVRALTASYESRGFYLDNDPATAARFTQAGYNAVEFGAEAA
jgi:hypothetical protein